ncbi:MAG TPA: deoxynucleoside kinase, partial [Mesotoga infera]|nr:deoxynucleoside kinase [Mesotoga infera]
EYDAYTTMFYAMINYLKNPDLLVYIDADIDTILTRIRRRGREMELAVPIAYWEQLDRLYSDWIRSYNRSPVYRIDARIVDIVTNPSQLDTVMRDIEAIING